MAVTSEVAEKLRALPEAAAVAVRMKAEHYFDVIRWIIGEEAPVSVSAHGGKFAVNDARDIPDTLEVTYEFASGRLLAR